MTYKRADKLRDVLGALELVPGIKDYHLIVTQSVREEDPSNWQEFAAILKNVSFMPITHVKSPVLKQDPSFSTNSLQFGSKRSAFMNLANGMQVAFESFPALQYLTVLEDDVVISPDMFEVFTACRSLMREHDEIKFSTAFHMFHDDHARRKRYTRLFHVPKWQPSPTKINVMHIHGIVFKTFAWTLTRQDYESVMRQDFPSLFAWSNAAKLHPIFEGCDYCENDCYDHYVEARFPEAWICAPDFPRVTQSSQGGMTEFAANATSNDIYHHFVPSSEMEDGMSLQGFQWHFRSVFVCLFGLFLFTVWRL